MHKAVMGLFLFMLIGCDVGVEGANSESTKVESVGIDKENACA